MKDRKTTLLMVLLKFSFTALVSFYPLIIEGLNTFSPDAIFLFLVFLLVSSITIYEMVSKTALLFIFISFSTTLGLYFFYDHIYLLIIPVIILDLLVKLGVHPFYGMFLLLLSSYSGNYYLAFILTVLFSCSLYYLVFGVIKQQIENVEEIFKTEKELKNKLLNINRKHKLKLVQTQLNFENQRLQEKSILSQNLHDKIGHAINGSIFKLEGAKLLVTKDTTKSTMMIEDVIGLLRASVDEIRTLLRNEKPGTGAVNVNRLKSLLVDFSNEYGIETNFSMEGDITRIPSNVWNMIYENTVEALTNSLKYAECSKINVQLIIFNKILRYLINDNGKGSQSIVEGMGLTGMKERINSVGGTVSIRSQHGFEINMLIPLRSEQDE